MRTTPISAAAMTYGRSVDVGAENTRLSRMAAAHAVFDSVEEDLECGCRLAVRRRRNLNFRRLDCFRLRIEIHLDGAAADPQLVSIRGNGCAFFAFPLRVRHGRFDRIVVELDTHCSGAYVRAHRDT